MTPNGRAWFHCPHNKSQHRTCLDMCQSSCKKWVKCETYKDAVAEAEKDNADAPRWKSANNK